MTNSLDWLHIQKTLSGVTAPLDESSRTPVPAYIQHSSRSVLVAPKTRPDVFLLSTASVYKQRGEIGWLGELIGVTRIPRMSSFP